jgi:hypothetical protein
LFGTFKGYRGIDLLYEGEEGKMKISYVDELGFHIEAHEA